MTCRLLYRLLLVFYRWGIARLCGNLSLRLIQCFQQRLCPKRRKLLWSAGLSTTWQLGSSHARYHHTFLSHRGILTGKKMWLPEYGCWPHGGSFLGEMSTHSRFSPQVWPAKVQPSNGSSARRGAASETLWLWRRASSISGTFEVESSKPQPPPSSSSSWSSSQRRS